MEKEIKEVEEFCNEYKDRGFYGIIKVEKMKALENLIKAYKETKKRNKEMWEANTKLNKVIDKMAEFMAGGNYYNCGTKEMIIEKYREEVENDNSSSN